ncbi:MAG: CHASE3 domain-containing protein [Pseudorhodoplanes sp.]|uniref:sensor histidine kinase n=1 Tax=Pseudorhodoplanes sp. TaxID=1934341 RepID=UPI003D0EF1CF
MSSVATTGLPRSPGAQPALLALGFLILVLISAASFWLVNRASDDAQKVVTTFDVQNRLSLVLLNLRRAESAQRGYIITGQEPYRAEYREAANNTLPAVRNAAEAVADDPALEPAFRKIEPLVQLKLDEMQRVVELHDAGKTKEAADLIWGGHGRTTMETVRLAIIDMYNTERALLETRRKEARRTYSYLLVLTLLGSAVIVLIGAISVYLVQRSSRQREHARRALQDMNENLEKRIEERTVELREANDEIQRFAYIVSHDLRSPLVNIMGFTAEIESIKKDIFDSLSAMQKIDTEEARKTVALSQDFDESLSFIKGSIGKMDRLINSILKLSREGQRTFKPEYVSMDQLIREIADAVAHQAAEQGAELVVEPLPPLKSDRLALEQIFSNLVDNALKYSLPGRPGHIRIRGRIENTQAVYEVEDNGRGIAPEDHQRVFDLFRRAGEQDQSGEGIGLAHTRALVRRLGGYMSLKSTFGEGSTFIVTLPRRIQESERQAA